MTYDPDHDRDVAEAKRHLAVLDDLLTDVDSRDQRWAIESEYLAQIDDVWVRSQIKSQKVKRDHTKERAELLDPAVARRIRMRARVEQTAMTMDDDEFEQWLALAPGADS